ncbi:uncharacterized protein [Watersipora subatra]|uniref:uncharacterized protein n=1 Tax=Watersipora subatra TaxID=2589382 RepID=UPI00355B0653
MDDDQRRRIALLLLKKKYLLLKQKKRTLTTNSDRRYWVHPINEKRDQLGVYANLIKELREDQDSRRHIKYLRISPENFDYILEAIKPLITKQDTVMRKSIEPGLKLAATLHHLAEGSSHAAISAHYRLGRSTVSQIIDDTCVALWTVLQPIYLKPPSGPDEWRAIAEGFERWNFPHCLGSIDGKHIIIQKPKHSGSMFWNYKQRDSIVLLAVCDASYRFTLIDIGQPGSNSDGGIWESSEFRRGLDNDQVNLPESEPLVGYEEAGDFPYMFVADEAFPLKPYIMRPFPGRALDSVPKRIFNYRLSRARRIIENTFGVLSRRWQILFKMIQADQEKATNLVRAMCVLHNFLRTVNDTSYTPPGYLDIPNPDGSITPGFWRSQTQPPSDQPNRTQLRRGGTAEAAGIRDRLVQYFSSPQGSVPWQDAHINKR